MDILMIVACLYLAYSNVTSLAGIPLAEWGLVQYAMAVLTVLLVVVGALKGWQFYKKKTAPKEETTPAATQAEEVPAVQKAEAESASAPIAPVAPAAKVDEDDWEAQVADFHYTLVDENPGDED